LQNTHKQFKPQDHFYSSC